MAARINKDDTISIGGELLTNVQRKRYLQSLGFKYNDSTTGTDIRAAQRGKNKRERAQALERYEAGLMTALTSVVNPAGESKAGISSGAGISDVFNMVSIKILAEEIGEKIQQSGSASANIIRRVDQGDTTTQTRALSEYRKLLDKTISSIMSNRIKKTIDDVLKIIKSDDKKNQKMKKKLDKNISAFLSGLTERVEKAITGFKMVDIDPGASKKSSSYTKLFDTLFGEGFQKSFYARGDILNKVADSQQCKIILQKRLKGELPFLYDYPDWVTDKTGVNITAHTSSHNGIHSVKNEYFGSAKAAFKWEKSNGKCYLCGVPFKFNLEEKQLECEHVLSIFLALRFMSIVRGRNYGDDEWNILNLEYELSHKCCNRLKDQIAFIMANDNHFVINDAEINAFYMNIAAHESMGCPTVWENIKSHHNKNIRNDDISKAKAFLTKRLQYIVDYLNRVHGGASQKWAEALSNFNAFKKISVDGRQIFQLHLCHSIIKALNVLTNEQLFVIIDRSNEDKTEFTGLQQGVFDNILGITGKQAVMTRGESKNGGGKTKKNQKGGNKIVSDAIKALRKEFIKIIKSDEPIIKEIDIFKHFLLTYGGQHGSIVIEPHTHYYVNNGDLEIVGSLTKSEKVLYDDTELNNIIGEIFETVKIENISNNIVSQPIQSIEQNKEDVMTLYNTMIQSGMNHTDSIKLGQDIITNGNLTKAVTLIRNTMIPHTMRTGFRVSQISRTNSILDRTRIPVFGGKKKKRKKRRTRKLKRKKKKKGTRKKRRK